MFYRLNFVNLHEKRVLVRGFFKFIDAAAKSQKVSFLPKKIACNQLKLFDFYFLKFVNFHQKRVFAGASLFED